MITNYLYSNRWGYLLISIIATIVSVRYAPEYSFHNMYLWHFFCGFIGFSAMDLYVKINKYYDKRESEEVEDDSSDQE